MNYPLNYYKALTSLVQGYLPKYNASMKWASFTAK